MEDPPMRLGLIAAALFALPLASACTSTGVADREMADGTFEIRAWNGNTCASGTSTEACEKALRPAIDARAEILCGGRKAREITHCVRRDAATGDRIYCYAQCDKSTTAH
jgi:hypothetical protein